MKVLILNPHIDAQHKIVQALKARGDTVFVTQQSDEAWQLLQIHGQSIDLAVIHREGVKDGEPGTELNFKIKKSSTFGELPVLFSSELWNDEQCANHQQTPMGANAYLRWPFDSAKLLTTIDAIFEVERTASRVKVTAPGADPIPAESPSVLLEDPVNIFAQAEQSQNSIKLESDAPPPPPQTDGPSLSQSSSVNLLSLEDEKAGDGKSSLPSAPSEVSVIGINLSKVDIDGNAPISPVLASGSAPTSPPDISANTIAETLDLADAPEGGGLDLLTPSSSEVVADHLAPLEMPPPDQPEHLEEVVASVPGPEAVVVAQEGAASPQPNIPDSEIAEQLPYLFDKKMAGPAVFSHPVGDAIVPGGATNAPDIETLKKYLQFREQDVSALSGQLRASREENAALESELRSERARAEGLELIVNDQKKKIADFEKEKAIALEALNNEIAEIRFQSKAKSDKAKLLEAQVNEATQEIERLKERVRADIRKIRVRERELENKLELTKKDSEVVLNARENKIIELKRKIDLLEFNMDLLQDRFSREKDSSAKLREKLTKAAQVVRVAEGLLDEPQAGSLKHGGGSLTESSPQKFSQASNDEKAS